MSLNGKFLDKDHLQYFWTKIKMKFASAEQGAKADTAVQPSALNDYQTKLSGTNKLDPAYIEYDATHRAVTDTEKSTWNGKQDTISDLSTIRSGAAAGATALQQSDVTSTYSASGTAPVNGTAVSDALGTLDVLSVGGSGKYISAIYETNGKINATPTNFDTSLSSSSTNDSSPTSKTVYDDQQRQDALEAEDRAALIEQVDEGAKNLVSWDIPTVRSLNQNATWTSDDTCVKGGITYKFNTDGTVVANGTADTSGSKFIKLKSNFSVAKGLIASCGLPTVSQDQSKGLFQLDYQSGSDLNVYDYEISKEVDRDGTVELYIAVLGGITVSNLIFKPMICTAADYAVSPKFVPYAPTNRELYEMIQALQNNS